MMDDKIYERACQDERVQAMIREHWGHVEVGTTRNGYVYKHKGSLVVEPSLEWLLDQLDAALGDDYHIHRGIRPGEKWAIISWNIDCEMLDHLGFAYVESVRTEMAYQPTLRRLALAALAKQRLGLDLQEDGTWY